MKTSLFALCAALCVLLAGCAGPQGPEPSSSTAGSGGSEISQAEPSSSAAEVSSGAQAGSSVPEASEPQEEPDAAPSGEQQPEEPAPESSSSSEAVNEAPETSSEAEQLEPEAPAEPVNRAAEEETADPQEGDVSGEQGGQDSSKGEYVGDKYATGEIGMGDYIGYDGTGFYMGTGSQNNLYGDFRGQSEPTYSTPGKEGMDRVESAGMGFDVKWDPYYGGWVYTSIGGRTCVTFPGGSVWQIG